MECKLIEVILVMIVRGNVGKISDGYKIFMWKFLGWFKVCILKIYKKCKKVKIKIF